MADFIALKMGTSPKAPRAIGEMYRDWPQWRMGVLICLYRSETCAVCSHSLLLPPGCPDLSSQASMKGGMIEKEPPQCPDLSAHFSLLSDVLGCGLSTSTLCSHRETLRPCGFAVRTAARARLMGRRT